MITIDFDDGLDRMARRIVDRVPAEVRLELERGVHEIGRNARASWPVKTGRSRDAFRWGVTGSREQPEAYVTNDATADGDAYADDVRLKGGGRLLWAELVRAPMFRLADQVAGRVGPMVARIAREA